MQQDSLVSDGQGHVGVTVYDDLRPGALAERKPPLKYGRPRVGSARGQLCGAVGIVGVGQNDTLAGGDHDLLVWQLANGVGRFVIPVHGDDRGEPAQLVQYPELTDIARVQQQVNAAERREQRVGQREPAGRHVGVGDQAQRDGLFGRPTGR